MDLSLVISSCAAGTVTGLLGTGGGIILVTILLKLGYENEHAVFPLSLAIITGISMLLFALGSFQTNINLTGLLPYALGGGTGGLLAGLLQGKVPTVWLHRILGILLTLGGIERLWILFGSNI